MKRCRPLCVALALLTLALEIPVTEFLELQALSAEARRTRLNLPETCVPAMTAVSDAPGRASARLLILVTCRRGEDSPDDVRWARDRSDQAAPSRATGHRSTFDSAGALYQTDRE